MSTKIQRNNLIDQISDYIKEKIVSNEWKTNDKLPSENELAGELGVSRMSLRAAIQRTNALGLTETRTGNGTYVVDFNMETIFNSLRDYNILENNSLELSEFLSVLQFGALGIIIANDMDIEPLIGKLETIYAKMEKLRGTNDFESLLEFDFKFHYQIILASRNTYLTLLYEGLSSLWQQALKNNLQHSYNHNKSYEFVMGFHHSIIEGLRNRDYHQCTEAQFGAYKRNFTYLKNSMKQ